MRTNKITSSGPNRAMFFLKKSKWTTTSRNLEVDVVTYNDAKKVCEKSNIEGQAYGILQSIMLIAKLDSTLPYRNETIMQLNRLRDSILSQSI